jgi:hypothetical protein
MDATTRPSQQLINAQKELARRRQMAGVQLPVTSYQWPVISDQYSVVSDQCSVEFNKSEIRVSEAATSDIDKSETCTERNRRIPIPNSALHIRISPTLAAHCLNRDHRYQGAALDGPYRLYKILGALDRDGRGWLASSDVENVLTQKKSPFYIYGRRQLKIILRRGEGLFWQRVKSKGQVRIRLVSRARLLKRLCPGSRLRGREVEIPLSYLLGSGQGSGRRRQAGANAALYAAVQAGILRPEVTPSGVKKPRPISRARLQELAGCSLYRQRSYERRLNITVERNIHILGAHSDYELNRARRHFGLPAYKHTDYAGKIDRHRRGASYIAVRLPNSYHLPDAINVVNSRRQRTINRTLDGLCHMGSGGSDREAIVRRYYSDIATAVRAGESSEDTPAYWPVSRYGSTRLWQSCGGGDECRDRDRGTIPDSALRIPHSIHPKSDIPNPPSEGVI